MAEYAEFRIRIERDAPGGPYRVEASGLGADARGTFESPFSDEALENFVLKVGRTRRGVRKLASPEWESAKSFGEGLFGALIQGRVLELYREALSSAQATRTTLRVTLALSQAPELAEIPWEYLYDRPNFLSISASTPVVRYLDVSKPVRPVHVELPIRILAVVSAPSDAEVLDAPEERRKLETALQPLIDANAVAIDWLEGATLLALSRKLRPDTYHILHFIGHGGFDEANQEGALLFEDEKGNGSVVSGEQLATVLNDKAALQLVFLNSCEGARTSRKDPFAGVAASLIEREIPAVIGMQFEITDRAAILFAGDFYASLAEGRPVDVAVTQARLTIYADKNDVEWGTPVLFMRVADGQLFDIADAGTLPRVESGTLPPKGPVPAGSAADGAVRGTGTAVPTGAAPPVAEPTMRLPRPPVPWRLVTAGIAVVAVLLIGAGLLLRPAGGGIVGAAPGGPPGILFSSDADKETGETDNELYMIDPETGAETRLTDNAGIDDMSPTWSPDYTQVAFVRTVNGSGDIFIADLRGKDLLGDPRPLTSGDGDDRSPAWSKEGWIAFVRTKAGETPTTIRAIHPDGRAEHEIVGLRNHKFLTPAWTVDGRTLAFATDVYRSDYDVAAVAVDGTAADIRRLSVGGTSDRNPAWSADGGTILFVVDADKLPGTDSDDEIYQLDVALQRVTKRPTANKVQEGHPAWSPDGTKIAYFRATSDGGFHIWVMSSNGTGAIDLMPTRPGKNQDPNWR